MLGSLFVLVPLVGAAAIRSEASHHDCPGYKASNVKKDTNSLTADLTLAGSPCNSYGTDLRDLKLLVEYQTGMKCFKTGVCVAELAHSSH